jgi:two-component system cell cycle sensor histidine kinase/response regulator CckA
MVVPDATLDPRFAGSPLVTGEPHIRFYAGAPLITPSGHQVGVLCLNDTVPRPPLTDEEMANLEDLASIVVDEMEFRLAERQRREAEKLFGSIFETAAAGIAVLDEAGKIVHVNPALCAMTGAPAEELTGKSFLEGDPVANSMRLRARDGHVLDIVLSSSLLAMDQERKLRVVIVTDVTEIRRTEAALRETNHRLSQLAAIIESSDDAIVGRTLEGVITSWNGGAERIYGYTAAEMIGHTSGPLLSPDLLEEFNQLTARLRRGETVAGHETERVCKDGRRLKVSLTLSPIKDAHGNVIGASSIARDITDRKLLEEQLVQSQKMEAVALLAGGVAHDFNNLLTIIIGYGRLMMIEAAEGSDAREYADEILHSAERASALTGQLLAFSRRQVVQPRVIDLNEAVQSMHRFLERILGEHIQLNTIACEGLGRVKADPGQIEQVIANLAVNARDAMPRGGHLTIETGNVELNEQYVRLHPQVQPGPYVMLAVTDSGTGMTPEVKERIFDPFFTTKDKGKGTGLGLSIIHGIVKQSGGEIWVYSEPGKGSTFKIYLPRVFEEAEVWRPVRSGEPMPHGTETILIVEDELAVKKMVRGILARLGYAVLEAANGQEALDICGSCVDPIHLMVTDVVMPGMAGPDLARAVKILRPETRIIFMSGYTESSMLHHELIEPDANFLQKPFTPEAFAQRVRGVLDAKD